MKKPILRNNNAQYFNTSGDDVPEERCKGAGRMKPAGPRSPLILAGEEASDMLVLALLGPLSVLRRNGDVLL